MKIPDYITDPTKKILAQALAEEMEKAPIDKISTSQLLEKVGVSRSTFYRHYRDKYDLLNQIYQLILDDTLFTVTEGASYKTVFYNLYTVLSTYPAFFKNALSSTDHNSLRNYIYEQSYGFFERTLEADGMDMKDTYHRLLLTGYITGSLEVTCAWAQNGMKEPLDMMFKLSYQMMPSEFQTCISLYHM